MRSRTGCLTCRQRKLKCDEKKPVCGHCTKGNRRCQPSGGLTFRHQHNASMNASGGGSLTGRDPSLSSFYSYKNTFDANTVWCKIPEQLTFRNTTNPYLDSEHDDPMPLQPLQYQASYVQEHQAQWSFDQQTQRRQFDARPESHSHGLEALSAAALFSPPEANMLPRSMSHDLSHLDHPLESSPLVRRDDNQSTPPGAAMSTSNNLNFLLNPASAVDSPIDPSLTSSVTDRTRPPDEASSPPKATNENRPEGDAESEQKIAQLLRHFSESPGRWGVG